VKQIHSFLAVLIRGFLAQGMFDYQILLFMLRRPWQALHTLILGHFAKTWHRLKDCSDKSWSVSAGMGADLSNALTETSNGLMTQMLRMLGRRTFLG
jgi:hypothetical protein